MTRAREGGFSAPNSRPTRLSGFVPERPLARTDLVLESVDDGTIVYVAEKHEAHYLDDLATSVWNACDGIRTPAEVGSYLGCDVALVDATLVRLADTGLLAPERRAPEESGAGLNRRAVLRRGAQAGAAMAVGAGAILTVDVPSALATMSQTLVLPLYRTPSTPCNQTLTSDVRGSVVVTVSAVAGNPALDKLTLVVTLAAYNTGGLGPETFNIAINCGATIGTITINTTGAGGPVTVTTTVPHNQVSVVTVTPIAVQPGFVIDAKASPSFVG